MRGLQPFLPSILFAVLLVVGYLFYGTPQPPLEYTQAQYEPVQTTVRPLDALAFTPALSVKTTGPVRVVRSFWNIDTNTSARLCDGSNAPVTDRTSNLPAGVANTDRANPVRVPVPNLPPGHYWLLTSAVGTTGAVTSYSVGFTVEEPC